LNEVTDQRTFSEYRQSFSARTLLHGIIYKVLQISLDRRIILKYIFKKWNGDVAWFNFD
jgi:hypothetical protein